MALLHGKMVVNTNYFEALGGSARQYRVMREIRAFGRTLRPGEVISRRKAIEYSATIRVGEEIKLKDILYGRGKRGGVPYRHQLLREYFKQEHGSFKGFTKFMREMDAVWPTSKWVLPDDKSKEIRAAWREILERWGLWKYVKDEYETFTPETDSP